MRYELRASRANGLVKTLHQGRIRGSKSMRTHELIDHRHAVLVQAWDSGKTEWFIKRCIKYAEVCPDSIWRGLLRHKPKVVETPWPDCLLSN
jgi:hypothetical protein